MARRRKVLGLTIGRRKSVVPKALVAAGAGIVGVPAAVAASRRMAGTISQGSEKVHQAADLVEKASSVKDAVSSHSTKIGKAGAVIGQLAKIGGSGGEGPPKLSHLIEEHTDVAVPRAEAYNQWTQFETFPSIVKGAERVEQKERDKVEWTSKIGPSRRTWPSEITEQVPDERIAWKSTGGLQMKGVVTFHSLDSDLTHVLVQIEYNPRGLVEGIGNTLRIQRRRVRRDLRLFKHFVELRGEATGAWRSRIAKKENIQESGTGSRGNKSRDTGRDAQESSNGKGRRPVGRAATNGSNGRRTSSSRSGDRAGGARRSSPSSSPSRARSGSTSRASSTSTASKAGSSRAKKA